MRRLSFFIVAIAGLALVMSGGPAAQQAPVHLAMIESVEGMKNLDAILSTPGITVASGAEMVKRLNEGWKMIRATVDIIQDGRALQTDRRTK